MAPLFQPGHTAHYGLTDLPAEGFVVLLLLFSAWPLSPLIPSAFPFSGAGED